MADCGDCEPAAELETLVEVATIDACVDSTSVDIELVTLGETKYVGLRANALEDVREAVDFLIATDGQNQVGILLHASAARQLAGALLNAADMLEGHILHATQADFDALLTEETE